MSKNQSSKPTSNSIDADDTGADDSLTLTADQLERSYPNYKGQIEHIETQPEQAAETVSPETVLPDEIASELPHDLYTHQATALEELGDGENVTVATSTSSGKTLVYALQIAVNHLENPDSTALLVYPTKALSRDQEQSLNDLYADLGLDINVQVYDGDTRSDRRQRIRETSDLIITNFSGLNVYLHDHARWAEFYDDLELFVIDESHSYTGVQGMHVAWTIRRLRRVLANMGSDPQVVLTSATIGNPAEHSKALTGKEVTVVDSDGSPQGRRDVVFWDPPGEGDEGGNSLGKKPADHEASELMAYFGNRDIQTLMFTRSRQQTERDTQRVQQTAESVPEYEPVDVAAYHAGLGKQTRRGKETQLKESNLDGIISTNALELGIDIGSVDATLLTGYPGTRQSFFQQLGRSGRGTSDSLGVLVPSYTSIDQYVLDNPEYLFGDNIEDAVVDLANNPVFAKHILCAADELPLTEDDAAWFGEDRLERAVQMWKRAGRLTGDLKVGAQYTGKRRPQRDISMYATSDEQFDIRCSDDELDLEPIDKERAYRDFHPGAVYLHQGDQYEVSELREDVPRPYVELERVEASHYTRTLSDTTIENVEPRVTRDLGRGVRLCWGKATVNVHYHSYQEIDIKSGEELSPEIPTGLSPIEMRTQLMWVEVPPQKLEPILADRYEDTEPDHQQFGSQERVLGGLHAAEHGLIGMAPLELRMSKSDLGGLSTYNHPELDKSALFIYDGIPGGLGFSRSIFEQFDTIAENTMDRVRDCSCSSLTGCPACVMSENCGDGNEPLHKHAAGDILDIILQLTT